MGKIIDFIKQYFNTIIIITILSLMLVMWSGYINAIIYHFTVGLYIFFGMYLDTSIKFMEIFIFFLLFMQIYNLIKLK